MGVQIMSFENPTVQAILELSWEGWIPLKGIYALLGRESGTVRGALKFLREQGKLHGRKLPQATRGRPKFVYHVVDGTPGKVLDDEFAVASAAYLLARGQHDGLEWMIPVDRETEIHAKAQWRPHT